MGRLWVVTLRQRWPTALLCILAVVVLIAWLRLGFTRMGFAEAQSVLNAMVQASAALLEGLSSYRWSL